MDLSGAGAKNNTYTLWTIQHEDAYREMLDTGVLRANENHLFCEDDLKFAYDWMSRQMSQRIGPPPDGIKYPVWAWFQWEGKRKRRDLRLSGYAKRGTPMVQIEFEIQRDKVLLSDFDDWHLVLNNSYCADSEEDFNAFYALNPRDAQRQTENSWIKIFNIESFVPGWTLAPDEKSIQATLWELKLSQVRKVEHFIAK